MPDGIRVEAPLGGEFDAVIRLIVGGVAALADFGFEELDDLQLAIERLLAEAKSAGRVTLHFEVAPGSIRTRVGPLRAEGLAAALQSVDGPPGTLSLRRVLQTVVDAFGVERAQGDEIVIRLDKLAPGGQDIGP